MKKRILSLLTAISLIAAAPSYCLASEPATEAATQAQSAVLFDSDEKKLEYIGGTALKDYAGNPAVLLIFRYTNKTSVANAALFDYFPTVYQNGVSLETAVISDTTYSSYINDSMTNIKDGASIEYGLAYALKDMSSDLEVEITDEIYGGNMQTFTIPASNSENSESAAGTTESVDWEEKYNELLNQYNDLLKKYNQITAEQELAAESEASQSVSSLIRYGELQDFTENVVDNKNICVIKVKIEASLTNEMTVDQNYHNIEYFVTKAGGDQYDSIDYWAVADMEDGSESKVVSFTVPKDTIDKIKSGQLVAIQLGDYVNDLYVLPSLQ